jgi:hypothetical protein
VSGRRVGMVCLHIASLWICIRTGQRWPPSACAHAGVGLAEARPARSFAPLVDCAGHAGRDGIGRRGERADVGGPDTIGDRRGLRRHPCVSCLNVAAGGRGSRVGGRRNESSRDEGQSGHRFSPHGDGSRTSSASKNQVRRGVIIISSRAITATRSPGLPRRSEIQGIK